MVKITQNVQAAFEVESSYGDPPNGTLSHLGLLDTFDPRAVEMNIAPIPSIGQSTDAFHARGPINVSLPLKVACQGTGWKALLGRAIGVTTEFGSTKTPSKLTSSVDSLSVLAKETGGAFTLVGGVVPNEVTLEADYTAGGFITLDTVCTAQFSEDSSDGNFTGFYGDNYSTTPFPAAPTADPLLPTDLTVSFSTASTDGIRINRTNGHSVEIGEKYMKIFNTAGNADDGYDGDGPDDAAILSDGVIDLDHSNTETITELTAVLNAGVTSSATAVAGSADPQNLLKGIYKMVGSNVTIPVVNDANPTLTEFSNLKTVALKIANNNTSIPGKTGTTWLQNNKISRGKADVTLDITTTAENETIYNAYVDKTTLPLVRLDFGTEGSIALTNGTVTAFSRPLAPGGEITETFTIKFRGNGDFSNYSAYAISADMTL
tara:strand:+ start:390 stop:1688 length:1299 start_codon:yes stop_codon:yes gene_type:complete